MTNDVSVELLRPIVGIENRTAQEAFDIMCDRIRSALSRPLDEERLEAEDDICIVCGYKRKSHDVLGTCKPRGRFLSVKAARSASRKLNDFVGRALSRPSPTPSEDVVERRVRIAIFWPPEEAPGQEVLCVNEEEVSGSFMPKVKYRAVSTEVSLTDLLARLSPLPLVGED